MMTDIQQDNLILLSTIRSDGTVELRLENQRVMPLANGEVLVRMEAAPINPSDIPVFLGSSDPASAKVEGTGADRRLVAELKGRRTAPYKGRLDQPMPVGNEGAGTVVDAAPDVRELIGKKVGMLGGAMYARYRTMAVSDCLILPDGAAAADGAALFINPLTALAMLETMRREGHRAIIHTAAASNLGQMVNRLCLAEGVGLVNVVRSPEQVEILKGQGAVHVLISGSDNFAADLTDAIAETGATLAFDATGGGKLANSLLHAMEAAAQRNSKGYNRYGSTTYKQVYLYGSLDSSLTELDRGYGMSWGVGGYLLTNELTKFGDEGVAALKARVVQQMTTTFASRYSRTIGLEDMLDPQVIRLIARRATGEKFLLDPSL